MISLLDITGDQHQELRLLLTLRTKKRYPISIHLACQSLTQCYRIIDIIMCLQHPTEGFGGGAYRLPHSLTLYASVCALAIVG